MQSKPTAQAKTEDVRRLVTKGVGTTIAMQLGIGRASVHRILGAA